MYDKYKTYHIEEFLLDTDFVNWALNGKEDHFWQNWLNENPDQRELVLSAVGLVQALKFEEEEFSISQKASLWNKIEASTRVREVPISTGQKMWKYIASVAAIGALLFIVYNRESDGLVTVNQDIATLIKDLPDETTIELIGQSEVSYDKSKWADERRITLKGSATFDVAKGSPFIVKTDNGEVRVLGTKFTIISEGKSFDVQVERGRVEVISEGMSNILTAGMRLSKNPQIESLKQNLPTLVTGKNTIFFQFKDSPFDEPLEVLKRNYNLNFVIPEGYTKLRYTGFFNSDDSVELALQKFFWPLNTQYKIADKEVEIILK